MTALTDTQELLGTRLAAVVAAFAMTEDEQALLAGEALEALAIDGAGAALSAADTPSMRLTLDVVVWRWVEARAALGFDFSADGGSYQRSQLAKQAAEMRRKAEDRAAAAGLSAFEWPAVVFEKPVNADLSDEWQDNAGIYQW